MSRAGRVALMMVLTAAAAQAPARGAGPVTGCPDVTFVGARASGERGDTHAGLGPAIEHLAAEIGERVARVGMTFRSRPVRYPAEPTRDLYLPWRGRVRAYFRSLAAGTAAAAETARYAVRRCSSTQLVLAGYSQGAMVIHRAERRLPAGVLARIAATVLVGDGDRVAHTSAVELGDAPRRAQGIRAALLPWTRGEVALPDRTADLCNKGDLICDFRGRRLLGPAALRRAIAAHRAYAAPLPGGRFSFSPLLARAARWATGLLLGGPVAPRGPTAVLTSVGAPFGGWRAATGEPVLAGSALPARLHRDACLLVLLPETLGPRDTAAIRRYLLSGGTVIGVGERDDGGWFAAADRSLAVLARDLGVALRPSGDALDPGTTVTARIGPELAALGVRRVGYDWATGLDVDAGARVLAWSADGSEPLLGAQDVGRGRFVMAGDSDLVTGGAGDAFGRGDNSLLARSLCP